MADDLLADIPEDDESEEDSDDFLRVRLHERLEHIQINDSPDATEEDAMDDLLDECGQTRDGGCLLAGSEYCDFECPFRDG